jgi:hypothetical protein
MHGKRADEATINSLKHAETCDTDDADLVDEDPSVASQGIECPICMASMKDGDIVSYNFAGSCSTHVYHHSCIKEWLLRHVSCPACRQTYLPIDEANSVAQRRTAFYHRSFPKSRHQILAGTRTQWMNRTFVCERRGLVVLELPLTDRSAMNVSVSATAPSLTTRDHGSHATVALNWIQKQCPAVKRHELKQLRGNKGHEGRTWSTEVEDDSYNQEAGAVEVVELPMGDSS